MSRVQADGPRPCSGAPQTPHTPRGRGPFVTTFVRHSVRRCLCTQASGPPPPLPSAATPAKTPLMPTHSTSPAWLTPATMPARTAADRGAAAASAGSSAPAPSPALQQQRRQRQRAVSAAWATPAVAAACRRHRQAARQHWQHRQQQQQAHQHQQALLPAAPLLCLQWAVRPTQGRPPPSACSG